MRDYHARSHPKFFLSFFTVSIIVFLDRILKIYFTERLTLGESIPVIPNIFHFTLVHNTGVAFGMLKDNAIVFFIPFIAVVFIIFYLYRVRHNKDVCRLYVFAFSLILGGAIGNLIDRVTFGYVIDFLDFRVWPVFNVADSAITIGTVIILFKCIPSFAK